MGIQGLLPFLQNSSKNVSVSQYSGSTVAVDAYCWLHKGAFSCAEKLARGEETDQYVSYCMKFINMLLSHNIKPIMVFDGCHLPAKAGTEKSRRERREANRKRAAELLRLDRGDEARTLLRRCVDVTHEMAHSLIVQCRARNVDCIVAPYEADAQLAYLNISGLAHFIITEDSDLLLFGCTKVVFKMDVQGNGILIEQEKLPISLKMRPEAFTLEKFRNMCILSGCDYLPSLPGIGLSKACKFIKLTAHDNIVKVLPKIGSYLNMSNLEVPEDYKLKFVQALAMFKHQPAYDPRTRRLVPLTPLPPGTENPVPPVHCPDVYTQIAWGNIDPISMKRLDNWSPDDPSLSNITVTSKGWNVKAKHVSIWSQNYDLPKPLPPPSDPRIVKHNSTFGKQRVQTVDDILVKIKKSPRKITVQEEVEILRSVYNVSPPSKRLCLDNLEGEVSSVDDLLGDETSTRRIDKFSVKSSEVSPARNRGLSLLSKIHRTQLPSPDKTVESKYFGTETSQSVETMNVSEKNEEINVFDIIEQVILADTVEEKDIHKITKSPKKSPSPRKNIFVISSNVRDENVPVTPVRDSCKKGLLDRLEQEDCSVKSSPRVEVEDKQNNASTGLPGKPSLGSFRWSKPLHSFSSPKQPFTFPETPPNSQDSDTQDQSKVAFRLPILPTTLQPAKRVGLSKRKNSTTPTKSTLRKTPVKSNSKIVPTSKTPPSSKQSLLNMFGFKQKEKLKA